MNEPRDLDNLSPEVAASIIAEDMNVDLDGIFVVADEILEEYYVELYRGTLPDCLRELEYIDNEVNLAILEAEVFDAGKKTIN